MNISRYYYRPWFVHVQRHNAIRHGILTYSMSIRLQHESRAHVTYRN